MTASRRVVIDGHNLGLEKGTGIATYARNLSACLKESGYQVGVLYGLRAAPDWTPLMREIAFYDRHAGYRSRLAVMVDMVLMFLKSPLYRTGYQVPPLDNVQGQGFAARMPSYDVLMNSPRIFEFAAVYFMLTRRLLPVRLPMGADIMHWTYPAPMYAVNARNVYTVHDVVPLRLPFATLDDKRVFHRLLRKIVARADHLVTVSDHSAADIRSYYPAAARKLTTTYQAVDVPAKLLAVAPAEVKEEIENLLPMLAYKGYFLFFGSLEPKKNIGRIAEAFLSSNVKDKLVIVGAQAWGAEKEMQSLQELNFARYRLSGRAVDFDNRIVLLNYLSYARLITLVRGARAILFPSLYEGFGIPPLEGMICDTPSIVSNTSCLPEICGPGALYVDPYDVRAIKTAIQHVASDGFDCGGLRQHWAATIERFSKPRVRARLAAVYDGL